MVLALYTLALFALIGLFFLLKRRNRDSAILDTDGALEIINATLKIEPVSNTFVKDEKGVILDPSHYKVFRTSGSSMELAGIHDGDSIVVRELEPSYCLNPKEYLETDYVVLLYFEESKKYKIRKVADVSDNTVKVYYYRSGKKVYSTKPYSVSQIKGVVQYKILR